MKKNDSMALARQKGMEVALSLIKQRMDDHNESWEEAYAWTLNHVNERRADLNEALGR